MGGGIPGGVGLVVGTVVGYAVSRWQDGSVQRLASKWKVGDAWNRIQGAGSEFLARAGDMVPLSVSVKKPRSPFGGGPRRTPVKSRGDAHADAERGAGVGFGEERYRTPSGSGAGFGEGSHTPGSSESGSRRRASPATHHSGGARHGEGERHHHHDPLTPVRSVGKALWGVGGRVMRAAKMRGALLGMRHAGVQSAERRRREERRRRILQEAHWYDESDEEDGRGMDERAAFLAGMTPGPPSSPAVASGEKPVLRGEAEEPAPAEEVRWENDVRMMRVDASGAMERQRGEDLGSFEALAQSPAHVGGDTAESRPSGKSGSSEERSLSAAPSSLSRPRSPPPAFAELPSEEEEVEEQMVSSVGPGVNREGSFELVAGAEGHAADEEEEGAGEGKGSEHSLSDVSSIRSIHAESENEDGVDEDVGAGLSPSVSSPPIEKELSGGLSSVSSFSSRDENEDGEDEAFSPSGSTPEGPGDSTTPRGTAAVASPASPASVSSMSSMESPAPTTGGGALPLSRQGSARAREGTTPRGTGAAAASPASVSSMSSMESPAPTTGGGALPLSRQGSARSREGTTPRGTGAAAAAASPASVSSMSSMESPAPTTGGRARLASRGGSGGVPGGLTARLLTGSSKSNSPPLSSPDRWKRPPPRMPGIPSADLLNPPRGSSTGSPRDERQWHPTTHTQGSS